MKLFRKVLDERQEQEIMRVERTAFWVIFFSLWISVLIQLIVFDFDITHIAGELAVGLIGAIWILIGNFRHGTFDYFTKPGVKAYILYSSIASVTYALLLPLRNYIQYGIYFWDSVFRTFAGRFFSFFVFMFVLLSIFGTVSKMRAKKLQKKYEDDNQDERTS